MKVSIKISLTFVETHSVWLFSDIWEESNVWLFEPNVSKETCGFFFTSVISIWSWKSNVQVPYCSCYIGEALVTLCPKANQQQHTSGSKRMNYNEMQTSDFLWQFPQIPLMIYIHASMINWNYYSVPLWCRAVSGFSKILQSQNFP